MPRQLIVYTCDAVCRSRYIAGMLRVLGRLNHTAQQDLAVIAIDGNGISVADTVIGKSALDLGDQQSIVRAFSRRVLMMLRPDVDTVIPAKRGVRVGSRRFGARIGGKHSAANQ